MDGTKSRLCRKTARNPSERFRKSSLNLLGTRVLMWGVSGCEDTCTVGDTGTCLERAFHALHFWESWFVSPSGPRRETSLYPRNTSTHHCFEVTIHHSSAPNPVFSPHGEGLSVPLGTFWYPTM